MANLLGWWRADTLSGSNNDPLSAWPDSSGNGNNLTQGTGASQPTLATNQINGLPAVRFDTQYFNVPSMLGALTQGEVIGVIKTDLDPPVDGAKTGIWNWGGTGERTHYCWTDGIIYDNFMSNARKTTPNPTPSLTAWRVYGASSQANSWRQRIDLDLSWVTSSNSVANSGASYVGLSLANGGSNYYLAGWIAEILFYSVPPSATDRSAIKTYLSNKYGLSFAAYSAVSKWTGDDTPNDALGVSNGVWQGTPAYAAGQTNNAFSLSGSNWVRIPYVSSYALTDFGMDCWIKLSRLPSVAGRHYHIFGQSTNSADLDLLVLNDNTLHFYIGTGGENVSLNPSFVTGQWYHIGAVYKRSAYLGVFCDALSSMTSTGTSRSASSNDFSIGESVVWTGRTVEGQIDEVRLWPTAAPEAFGFL